MRATAEPQRHVYCSLFVFLYLLRVRVGHDAAIIQSLRPVGLQSGVCQCQGSSRWVKAELTA